MGWLLKTSKFLPIEIFKQRAPDCLLKIIPKNYSSQKNNIALQVNLDKSFEYSVFLEFKYYTDDSGNNLDFRICYTP